MESSKQPVTLLNVCASTTHLLSIFDSYSFTHSGLAARAIPTAATFSPARAETRSLPKTSTVSSCAFREQRDALAVRPSPLLQHQQLFELPSSLPSPNSWRDGRGRPHVRTSNEHLLSVRVPGAQRSLSPSLPSYCHPDTSYPFSIKHRTTASAYGGSGSSGL